MRIGLTVLAGLVMFTATDIAARESGVGRMTADLEASSATEGGTSLCT